MDRITGFTRLFKPNLVSLVILLVCLLLSVPVSQAQTSAVDEKSQKIIDRGIEVLGGQAYLNVQTVVGKGFYSEFRDGASQVPIRFLDYLAYPDRERTEFTSLGIRNIQTNVGDTGWMFDGAVKKISDQTPGQVEEFKRAMRTTFDNLLRGWWKNEGGKVTYVGRREAGLAKRNETVRLTYSNGFWIEYEFGARDGMPAKIIYKRMRKDPDSGDQVETTEEEHFMRFVDIGGVQAPWIVDRFINGKQTARINYEQIQYNQRFPDTLWAKPDNVKSIK